MSYAPPNAGCKEQPQWAQNASGNEQASKFNEGGWSGYCQIGWSACPDARFNKDYDYYAKSLGPDHIKKDEIIERKYCDLNGWLEPEFRDIVHNFSALQAKGEQFCREPDVQKHISSITLDKDLVDEMTKKATKDFATEQLINALIPFKIFGIIEDIKKATKLADDPKGFLADYAMDESVAHIAAAQYCALGDVSCEIAYCNYAFCKHPDGRLGTMSECDGWNDGKGMSASMM